VLSGERSTFGPPAGTAFVCPLLVGRAAELAALRAFVSDGGVALVAGEAGVGKSRLVGELLASPEAAACARVRVACLEPDVAEPYALVLELVEAAGGRIAELPIGGAPEVERQVRRVEQAVRAVLGHAAADRPFILVAEDLHWSDAPSLAVLLGLAQRPGPLRLVGTYRPAPSSAALAGFLAELARLRLAREVVLPPLGPAEVARMISATLGSDAPVSGVLLDEVVAATDGVPFLVEEVLRALAEGGALERRGEGWRRHPDAPLRTPGSLRQAIEARLLAQPPEVAQVAALAAAVGQVLDLDLVRQLSGLDEPALLAVLRALVGAQLLEPRPDGRLAFRHALSREAVLARLLEPERRALHRRVAEALEANPGSASPATLAHHWAQAGDAVRAGLHALCAAERAAAVHAHREAIVHYELALAGRCGPPAALLQALGDHHAGLGEIDAAVARYREAQALGGVGAELELRIGLAYERDRQRPAARRHLAAAFAGLPLDHPKRWLAGLHLARQLAATGDYGEAEAALGEALRTADADALARLRVAYELGGLRALRGDWAALDEAAAAVLREAPEDDDEALALRHDAHAALGTLGYYRGAFGAALEHFRACLHLGRRRGLVSDQAVARWNMATNALYNLGRWPEVRTELGELQALGFAGLAETSRLVELWLDGRWEPAAEAYLRAWQEMLELIGDLESLTAHGRRVADILLALGRPAEAHTLVERVVARIRVVGARSFELQLAPREAEALARLGDPRAADACDTGLALARDLGARPAEGLLLRARGLVRRTAGRWSEAFADFDAAVALLDALPMPYEAARTRREAGLARLARGRRGDRERGAELLRAAQRLFAGLGAARDEAATGAVLSAAGLAGRADRGTGPLSAREREVAALVAEGLSNREIAERLFIAEKTAAFHVGAILNKLGFDSRAQIAAYVARHESG
jgi:DNA-binding CsgD family transcriptional regulator/tetratricopeptide (TPR) repeat protein